MMKKTVIISCERSGLNMFRIMTEIHTGHQTPGNKKYDIGHKDLAFVRSHNIKKYGITPKEYKVDKMILLLRHPVRHWQATKNKGMIQYATNLKDYERFTGEKMVIYYEDMLKSKRPYYKAWEFLGLSYQPINNFQKSLEEAGNFYKSKKKKKKIGALQFSDNDKEYAISLLNKKINKIESKPIKKYLI